MSYKLGLWGARADKTGLGYQTREFYRNMKPDKTQVIDISDLNHTLGKKTPQFEWYKNEPVIHGFPNSRDCIDFCEGIDVAFLAESPYIYDFYYRAREAKVKTAVQYNFEFFDFFKFPEYPKPDMLIAPSMWRYDEINQFAKEHGIEHIYLHCPVNPEPLKEAMHPRIKARTFIHIAGHPAAFDRNGTESFLDATKLMKKTGCRFIVYTQNKEMKDEIRHNYKDVEVRYAVPRQVDLYKDGDVLVLPRRYGGNCLPMNEAVTCSMPVIMPNIDPNNKFLPSQWLVDAEKIGQFEPRTVVDIFGCNPQALAFKMYWFASLSAEDMIEQSKLANELGKSISWEVMKPKYQEAFERLANA